jgi:hypothetical protein
LHLPIWDREEYVELLGCLLDTVEVRGHRTVLVDRRRGNRSDHVGDYDHILVHHLRDNMNGCVDDLRHQSPVALTSSHYAMWLGGV